MIKDMTKTERDTLRRIAGGDIVYAFRGTVLIPAHLSWASNVTPRPTSDTIDALESRGYIARGVGEMGGWYSATDAGRAAIADGEELTR